MSESVADDITNMCLLVSDSDEHHSQYDSKKVSYSEFAGIMQDELFKTYLNIMDKYLKTYEYEICIDEITQIVNGLTVPDTNSTTWKFQVVPGQVILVKKSELDKWLSANKNQTTL